MGNFIYTSSPFCDCFLTCTDGKSDAFLAKMLIEFSDTGGVGLINERMVDSANCGTSIDTGKAIDGEDLRKPRLLTYQRICAIKTP